jgi:hypothetical protein
VDDATHRPAGRRRNRHHRDYEYTDWDELSRFVVAFEQLVAGTGV